MDTFLFPQGPDGKPPQVQRKNVLLDATIRDFSGGWNVVDNDLNLDTKFSKLLENMQRSIDGSNSVRPGTRLFADTEDYLDEIINCEYFNNFIVCVGANGKLVKIDSSGIVTEIWNDNLAGALPGAPSGWATTVFASFAQFNGSLIVCNGVNKPLIIDTSMNVTFLQDLADKTNTNTPIARFVVAHGRYLVMAGSLDDGLEDRLFISATDVGGTWVGDSAPNDAVNLDLGSRVPSGSNVIKGLGRFRDKIMVMFENAILPGTLGVFDGSDHTPTFDDAIENVGAISHRGIQTIGEDMLFGDVAGISNVKRALFTGNVSSSRASQLIDPAYLFSVGNLAATAAQEDRVWSLWDSQANNFMVFVPDTDVAADTTETRCFVYKRNVKLKIAAWQDWRNWNFRSGCQSALKRIFLTEGTQVYILGEDYVGGDRVFKDYEGDQEMWDDDTPWSDYTGWNPVADTADSGVPIKFVWELPWSDNKERFLTKASRYIGFDTVGDNRFLVEMFVDNIYKDRSDLGEDWVEDTLKWDDGLGWDVDVLDPTLSMVFEGGDAPGFGGDEFGEDFGGGRPTRLEKLFAWTARYKIEKLRISGDATKELKFIAITLAYQRGSLRR
jgi:hypothetical protein|tara:strand:- start:272 stop:2104 length:1833 start_codon:yes stop_codon:yes gene_type:complete